MIKRQPFMHSFTFSFMTLMHQLPGELTIKITRKGISLKCLMLAMVVLYSLPVILFFTLVLLKAPEPLPLLALLLMVFDHLGFRLIAKRAECKRLVIDIPVRNGLGETHGNIVNWLRQRRFEVTSEEKEEVRFIHGTIGRGHVELHLESILKEDAFGRSIHGEFYLKGKGLGLDIETAPTRKIWSLSWYPGTYKVVEEFINFLKGTSTSQVKF